MTREITSDIYEALCRDPDPFIAMGTPIAVKKGILKIVDPHPPAMQKKRDPTAPGAHVLPGIRVSSVAPVKPREITPDIYEALLHDSDPFVAMGTPIAVRNGVLKIVDP